MNVDVHVQWNAFYVCVFCAMTLHEWAAVHTDVNQEVYIWLAEEEVTNCDWLRAVSEEGRGMHKHTS